MEKETARLAKEMGKLSEEIAKLDQKLGNEAYVSKAAPDAVEKTRAKHAELSEKHQKLHAQWEKINTLKGA